MNIELDIFSPVQRLHNVLFEEHKIQVYVKRDDLIHPFISGNKWRKLKYALRQAQTEGKTHLVTFGGAYSNHLLATAAAAAQFGFTCTGIVRGEEEVDNDTLFLCRLHGMTLIFTDRESYRNKERLFEHYFGNDLGAFYIPEGGASVAGTQGCAEIISELNDTYDDILCAAGTGTTAAGILTGIHTQPTPTHLHVVSVLKNHSLASDIHTFTNISTNCTIHTDYHFGGYAKTAPELIQFIKTFTQTTGMLIEPVYTGKMFYALFDLIKKNHFKPGSKILTIHTGGLFGILGMKKYF